MADLKRLRSLHDLVLFGREFHNLAPHMVSDWSPYLVVFEWGMHNVLAFLRLVYEHGFVTVPQEGR